MSCGQIPIEVEEIKFALEYNDELIIGGNSKRRVFRVWAVDKEVDKKLRKFAINSGTEFYLNNFLCYLRSDSSVENERRQSAIINQFKNWLKEGFFNY